MLYIWLVLLWTGLSQDQLRQQVDSYWTARDGGAREDHTLAQPSYRVLWLGTRNGLFSFDAISFTSLPLVQLHPGTMCNTCLQQR